MVIWRMVFYCYTHMRLKRIEKIFQRNQIKHLNNVQTGKPANWQTVHGGFTLSLPAGACHIFGCVCHTFADPQISQGFTEPRNSTQGILWQLILHTLHEACHLCRLTDVASAA